MKIRTISQLEPVRNKISENTLFEVSEPRLNGMYTSKNVKFSSFQNQINETLSSAIETEHGLNDGDKRLSLKEVAGKVDTI